MRRLDTAINHDHGSQAAPTLTEQSKEPLHIWTYERHRVKKINNKMLSSLHNIHSPYGDVLHSFPTGLPTQSDGESSALSCSFLNTLVAFINTDVTHSS